MNNINKSDIKKMLTLIAKTYGHEPLFEVWSRGKYDPSNKVAVYTITLDGDFMWRMNGELNGTNRYVAQDMFQNMLRENGMYYEPQYASVWNIYRTNN